MPGVGVARPQAIGSFADNAADPVWGKSRLAERDPHIEHFIIALDHAVIQPKPAHAFKQNALADSTFQPGFVGE